MSDSVVDLDRTLIGRRRRDPFACYNRFRRRFDSSAAAGFVDCPLFGHDFKYVWAFVADDVLALRKGSDETLENRHSTQI